MIKITGYKLSGYKNVGNANLDLGNFNVIVGPNNSGKSNFLQSISFLNYLINSSSDELSEKFESGFITTHFKEIAPLNKTENSFANKQDGEIQFDLKTLNTVTNRETKYVLIIEWKALDFAVSYKIKNEELYVKDINKPGKATNVFKREFENVKFNDEFSRKTSLFEKAPDSFSVVRILKLIAHQEDFADAVHSLNTVIKAPIFYFSNTELLKTSSKERLNEFNGRTVAYNLKDEIIALEEEGVNWEIFSEAVKNILNITDVRVFKYSTSENKIKGGEHDVKILIFYHLGISKEINQLSDGSILIIAIICKILSIEEEIIFVEEPENSTHPRALIDLLAFFKSFSENKQFILTSHSIALLNKTRMEEVIASCVSENGETEFFNIESKKDLKNRLKQSYINFSDELFFGEMSDIKEEFEF